MNIASIFSHNISSSRWSGCAAGLYILLALCGGLELITEFLM